MVRSVPSKVNAEDEVSESVPSQYAMRPAAPVPDPYYSGEDGFDEVLDLCLAACRELLQVIRREHGL